MPIYRAPVEDALFIIREMLKPEQYDIDSFGEALELVEPLLEEGAKLCEQVLFPLNQQGDKQGCRYDHGKVVMPDGFKEAYKLYCDGGWPSFTAHTEYGGQGLPEFLSMPVTEFVCSANLSFGLTPGLSHGAYNAIYLHGTDELRQRFLPHIATGNWSGVMCLTEPQAGTDLGLLTTRAEPRGDGTYGITGNKIFISSGEQDLTENILHLVLARLPDAPKGVKGISLFLVPKIWVNEDGTLGDKNGVVCGGLEEKMGIHASATCVMNYDDARGYLIGEAHKGLKAMFTMMNAARIYVGVQGLGLAEVAWQNARAYANDRLQGRGLKGAKFPDKKADPITVHPDVRRMLLLMRSHVEAGRALVMETALKLDVAHRHADAAVREEADDFVQLMTPIVKAHLTDMGHEVANMAMQVYGGHGYIREYGIEQYARDARIAQIYEGTNGIQAMDLVGRKLPHQMGKYLRSFFHPVQAFVDAESGNEQMKEFAVPLGKALDQLQQASLWIAKQGLVNPDDAGAAASEYLKMFSHVTFAWIWARQAKIAQEKLAAGTDKVRFYQDKLDTARFFMARVLPQTVSLMMCLTKGSATVMQAEFGSE